MANSYLLPIYRKIYGYDFDYGNFENRLEMQKAVYLLQDMGVPVGDYGFRWYQHGPYSQSLQDDMFYECSRRQCKEVMISKEHAESIERLRKLIIETAHEGYSLSFWVECVASLHYLKENVLHFGANYNEVVRELERRKPHLNNHKINLLACRLVEGLF